MLWGSVEVWTKNIILSQFIESQTHFGMPRGTENDFSPLMNRIRLLFIEIQKTTSVHAHKWKEIIDNLILYAYQPIKSHTGPTPNKKSPIDELKDNSYELALIFAWR